MPSVLLLQQDWLWTAIAAIAAIVSLPLAIWSLRQSSKALRVNLPAPEITWRKDSISVRVHEQGERHFGISAVQAIGGHFRLLEVYKDEDGDPSVRPAGSNLKKIKYDPPVALTTLYVYVGASGKVRVKVASRADPNISAWILYPVQQR